LSETGDITGMVAEAVFVAADRREAIGIDDSLAIFAGAALPLPAERARRVARSGDRYQRQIAETYGLSRHDLAADPRGGERVVHAGLRVLGGIAPAGEHRRRLGRRQQARAGAPLKLCQAADVVEMLAAVQQELHIRKLEAERLDVRSDRRGASGGPSVDEHVAPLPGDEQGRDAA